MAGSVNKVILVGNLGRDPEVRSFPSGGKVVSLRVAEQYLRKGAKVYIEGQLQTRKWQDQSGQDRYTTEVVIQRFRGELTLLDSRGGGGEGTYEEPGQVAGQVTGQVSRGGDFGRAAPPAEKRPALAGAGAGGGRYGDLDDEIPF